MTPFEYVTVLVSIILGMGITQIVTGIADLVHQAGRVRVYWPHLLWIILVFFLHIQEWWSTYELRHFESFRLPTFLFVLLYPINLFILARILFPMVQPEGVIDLKAFYESHYRRFFLWASLLPVLSFLQNVLVIGIPVRTQAVHGILFFTLLLLVTRRHVSELIHKALAILLLSIMIIVVAVEWNDLLTSA
jgi:hypothetical protein